MCSAPEQTEDLDAELAHYPPGQTVIRGHVVQQAVPVPGAYVRLLDSSGEFVAEVVSSATGNFQFFAFPGQWTLRALAPGKQGQQPITATEGITKIDVELADQS